MKTKTDPFIVIYYYKRGQNVKWFSVLVNPVTDPS